jgi:general secretion pathway protein L
MKTLRLALCPLAELGAESVLEFEVLDDKRRVLERGQAVPAALPRLPRTELVIAAADVLLLEAALPPLSGARLRAALPALAEPYLVSSIESAYVVAATPAAGRTTLAVIDRALLARALELLRRLKLVPASAVAEQLSLPLQPGRWRLRVGPAHSCLRMSVLRGIACSPAVDAAPPVELQLALKQAGAALPQAIEVEGPCPAEAWSEALGVPVAAVAAPDSRTEPPALELLQYEFAARLADWRAWRVPAALAVLCALTWLVALNVDAWLMRREERALRAHMEATLREAFPGTPVVLDPLAQMRRGVADLRAGAGNSDPRDFLGLALTLSRALAAESDAVRALEFRDGALRVDFDPRALEAKKREALLEKVSAAGLAGRFSESTLSVRAKGDGS